MLNEADQAEADAAARFPSRGWLRFIVDSNAFNIAITALIILNAVTLSLETAPSVKAAAGDWLRLFDDVLLSIFVAEIVLKLIAHGPRFFRNGWNVFDFVIVGISLLPFLGNLSILRAFRVLRVLRILSLVPRLRMVVTALIEAIPGMGAIVTVLLLVFFVSSVLATTLFGGLSPDYFGSIGDTMFTLFQIMTLEAWSEIARPILDEQPWAWLFFVPFIVVSAFMVLNLFIAVIVNSLQQIEERELAQLKADAEEDRQLMEREFEELHAEIRALREELRAAREAREQGRAAE